MAKKMGTKCIICSLGFEAGVACTGGSHVPNIGAESSDKLQQLAQTNTEAQNGSDRDHCSFTTGSRLQEESDHLPSLCWSMSCLCLPIYTSEKKY